MPGRRPGTPAVERVDGYAPIGSYALLGDGHGAALVCRDGAVDWLAVPAIDSAPFLAGILDAPSGGSFRLAPSVEHTVSRRYLEGTMVLETTFACDGGSLVLTDALNQGFEGRLPWSELVRRAEVEGGPVPVDWELRPGNRLATVQPWVHERHGIPFVLAGNALAALVLEGVDGWSLADEDRAVRGSAVLEPGRPALLALVVAQDKPLRLPRPLDVRRRLDHTVALWRRWSSLLDHESPHRPAIERSALVIKSLASAETGATAAAPTTSLPEVVGGSRNFDYRLGWVRDSSFMVDALSRLGLSEEVDASLSWLLRAVGRTSPHVHVCYRLDGRPAPGDQEETDLVAGYRHSTPVVLGNKAASQTQHGSHGDLLGAVERYVAHGGRLDTETGLTLAQLGDHLCDVWWKPDAGIWELGTYRRYTSSLINAWTALDRLLRLVGRGEVPELHRERWETVRDRIHRFTDERCWSYAQQSYTFYAGTDDLDAATLLAARTGFLRGDDRRLHGTIDAVRRQLTAEGPFLYRYSGAEKEEHTFVACTFWLIEALCYAGRVEEAGSLLDGALDRSNDVGLWAEEVDPTNGELLGNFPIGLSHLSVIGAVTAYAQALAHGATPPP